MKYTFYKVLVFTIFLRENGFIEKSCCGMFLVDIGIEG